MMPPGGAGPGQFGPPPPPSGPPGGYGVGMPPGIEPDGGDFGGGGAPTDPLAWVSLALGALGLATAFCCWPLMFALACGGIVTGIIALVQNRSDPRRHGGRGLAITGIVLSVLAPLSYVLLVVLFGVLSFLPTMFP